MALCNARRASDIQALDIRFKRSVSDNMVFTIPGLTKTRRSGPPKQVSFYAFSEVESLCPVKTIQIYMERTALLRINSENEVTQLIISDKKLHKPVKAGSISRWIKETLSDAGVNTVIFKSHSTRAASPSAASARGVSVNDIMAMAGWSRSSTFEKYYHKQLMILPSRYFNHKVCFFIRPSNNTLSYVQPCHDVELIILQGSDVKLEFH